MTAIRSCLHPVWHVVHPSGWCCCLTEAHERDLRLPTLLKSCLLRCRMATSLKRCPGSAALHSVTALLTGQQLLPRKDVRLCTAAIAVASNIFHADDCFDFENRVLRAAHRGARALRTDAKRQSHASGLSLCPAQKLTGCHFLQPNSYQQGSPQYSPTACRVLEYALQQHLPAGAAVEGFSDSLDAALQGKAASLDAQVLASR